MILLYQIQSMAEFGFWSNEIRAPESLININRDLVFYLYLCLVSKFNPLKDKEFESYLDKNSIERLRVKLKLENGILSDIVFQYESFIENKWHPIVRYDCAHGFFHRDTMRPNGDKEKQSIEIGNLKDAARYAEQDLKDRWDWYKERYLKGIKKQHK